MSRTFKTTCIICCLCLLVCVLAIPAYAEVTYPINAADYVSDVVYDGNNKTVICDFTGLPWSVQFGGRSSETVFATGTNVSPNYINEQYIFCYCYPFKNNVHTGGIDISGIAPGSPFELTFTYDIVLELFGSHSLPGTVEIGCNFSYYDSNKQRIGAYSVSVAEYTLDNVLSGTTTPYSMDVSGVVPVDAVYLNCFLGVDVEIDSVPEDGFGLTMYLDDLAAKFRIDYNMLDVQSDLMQAANNKLDEINGQLGDIEVGIGDVNDKLDQILQQPEQEKNDATQGANDAFSGVVDVVPDHSEGLADAFSGLASSMSYNGTVAKLDIPAVSMPGLDGLFDGFVVMQPQQIDFEVYFDMLPDDLLLLVQSLFTAALIVFCFKELYSTIQYCLTLRG